jgi:phage terminase Nu1 subunit (DNA packaging protein)
MLMAELRGIRSIEPLVTREELAELPNVSTDTIDAMRRAGMPWIPRGARIVRFQPSEALAWLENHGKAA